MNKIIGILIATCIFLVACKTSVNGHPCIGLNGKKVPGVEYEYSAWNIVLGIIFVQTIIPPVLVVLDGLECPVEGKSK